jgi:molybdopterin-guanine dinucleotide biosynthesis protein
MKSVIVTITGYPRTGKDTLANAIAKKLTDEGKHVVTLSSIDTPKHFMRVAANVLELPDDKAELIFPLNSAGEYEPTDAMRNGLASIKAVLDDIFDWTVELAFRTVERTKPDVLIYQVRELENVNKLTKATATKLWSQSIQGYVDNVPRDPEVGGLSIFVNRLDRPRITGAFSESYVPGTSSHFDYAVNNIGVEALCASGDAIALQILRMLDKS